MNLYVRWIHSDEIDEFIHLMILYETGIIAWYLINKFIETSTKLTFGTSMSAFSLLLEDVAPTMLSLKYWAVDIMRQTWCVGIIALEVAFAKWPVGFPSGTALSVVDSAVTVAGSAVAALADNDRVRRADAASLRVGTGRTDNARGNAGSLGVVNLGKDNAPPVACVARWLLCWVGVRGFRLCNMLSMNSTEMKWWKIIDILYAIACAINIRMLQVTSTYAAAGAKVAEGWKGDVAETATDITPENPTWHS